MAVGMYPGSQRSGGCQDRQSVVTAGCRSARDAVKSNYPEIPESCPPETLGPEAVKAYIGGAGGGVNAYLIGQPTNGVTSRAGNRFSAANWPASYFFPNSLSRPPLKMVRVTFPGGGF